MGWLYGWSSRSELVEHLTGDGPGNMHVEGKSRLVTLAYCLSGNNLWAVQQWQALEEGGHQAEPMVFLYMLNWMGKKEERVWGYKDVDEAMGLTQVTCPLRYLEMAPCPSYGYGAEWRDRVRVYWAERCMKREVGGFYALKGCNIPWVRLLSLKPLRGQGSNGRIYSLRPSILGAEIFPLEEVA